MFKLNYISFFMSFYNMSLLIGNPKVLNKNKCLPLSKNNEINKSVFNVNKVLKQILDKLHIKYFDTYKNNYICNHVWVRDNFITIHNTKLLLPITNSSTLNYDRSNEYISILRFFNKMGIKYVNLVNNKKIRMEGGDIIQNDNTIFVGIGERTNLNGYKYLKSNFKKHIFKVRHTNIHLDCCFALLKNNIIIYSKKYIDHLDKGITDKYKVYILEDIVDTKETTLALNFLLIGNNIIISNHKKFSKLRVFLRKLGYKLYLIDFKYDYIFNGSIRCFTQWIDKPNYVDIY